jgi:hypothetical protein
MHMSIRAAGMKREFGERRVPPQQLGRELLDNFFGGKVNLIS